MVLPRYLYIDLSRGEVFDYPISQQIYRTHIGGKSLAARLLLAEMQEGVDPLEPASVFIINTGPLTGTGAPACGRFNISCKNVLTGGIASSNCGGNFGYKLRRAGLEGLIITGKAPAPVYIEVKAGEARICDAAHLWGMNTEAVQEELPGGHGKVVIGPAGENGVSYACVVSQERVAGRCGVGAVMGSKNLKAVTAFGQEKIPVARPRQFRNHIKKWWKTLQENKMTGEVMPGYGTMGFVNKAAVTGVLPVKNFSRPHFPEAEKISGEYYADNFLTRNFGCVTCPIRCGRRQMLDGKEIKGPEYETVGLLGSNLQNSSMERISRWNYLADTLGLDTISLGTTLSFAMELKEKGMADLGPDFWELDALDQIIEDIACRRQHGDELARGSLWLAQKYGGKEFANQSKGLEMPAYDPRRSVGMGLGYATANRGACHLNGGYLVFLEAIGPINIDPQTIEAKPALTIMMQNSVEAISSAGSCLFTSLTLLDYLNRVSPSGMLAKILASALQKSGKILEYYLRRPRIMAFNSSFLPHSRALGYAMGVPMTLGRFLEAGEAGFNTERLFNIREGLDHSQDRLNKRLEEKLQDENIPDSKVPIKKMLPRYYAGRGWDEEGVPRPQTLKRLGIEDADS